MLYFRSLSNIESIVLLQTGYDKSHVCFSVEDITTIRRRNWQQFIYTLIFVLAKNLVVQLDYRPGRTMHVDRTKNITFSLYCTPIISPISNITFAVHEMWKSYILSLKTTKTCVSHSSSHFNFNRKECRQTVPC